MSIKSRLSITLDFPEGNQEDLLKLKNLLNINYNRNDYFSGWTTYSDIGEVYDLLMYNNLFLALDKAAKKYLPIVCKFTEIKKADNSIQACYYPRDRSILEKIRNYMEGHGVEFINPLQNKLVFSIYVEVKDGNFHTAKEFVPNQTEVAFSSVSIFKHKKRRTRLYYRARGDLYSGGTGKN